MKKSKLFVVLAMIPLLLAGCGGSGDDSSDSDYSNSNTGNSSSRTDSSGDSSSNSDIENSSSIANTTFTVTWQDYDGTVLETDTNVEKGTMPSYDGETPTRPDDSTYTYTFKEWTPTIVVVTADATYTATYTSKDKNPTPPSEETYTVTWKNYDGTVLEVDEKVEKGTMPTYDGETPTRANDDTYSYTWSDWDPEVVKVTADATYTATYDKKALSTIKTEVSESEFVAALNFENKNFALSMASPGTQDGHYDSTNYYQMENHTSYAHLSRYENGKWVHEFRVIMLEGGAYAVYSGTGNSGYPGLDYSFDIEWQSDTTYFSFDDVKEEGAYGDLNGGIYFLEHNLHYSDFTYDLPSKTYKGEIDVYGKTASAELRFEDNNLVKVVLTNDEDEVTMNLSRYGEITKTSVEPSGLLDYIERKNISADRLLELLKNAWSYYPYDNDQSTQHGLTRYATYTTEWVRKDATTKAIENGYKNEVEVRDTSGYFGYAYFSEFEHNGTTFVKQGDYKVTYPFENGFSSTYVKESDDYVVADDDHQYSFSNSTQVGFAFAMCMLRYQTIKDLKGSDLNYYAVNDYVVTFVYKGANITVKYEYTTKYVLKEFTYLTSNSTDEETFRIYGIDY